MKKFLFIIVTALLLSACATTKEARSDRAELRKELKLENQAMVRHAVESQRFIVKLDRLYVMGGLVRLKPRANYIIVDGNKAIINAAYFGRQFDIRPIAGINIRGIAEEYELIDQQSKGMYKITMRVGNDATNFDVYLTIGKDGLVSASLSGSRIQNAQYAGYVVPISNRTNSPAIPLQDHDAI